MSKCKICGEEIKDIDSKSQENYHFNCYLNWSKTSECSKILSYTGEEMVNYNE